MDPVAAVLVDKGMAKLADLAFTAALAGLNRVEFVDFVRAGEAAGKTADQITDELQAMRQQSEKATQANLDGHA